MNQTVKPKVDMRIYREYFDMIKSGKKTIEIRVAYDSMLRIGIGTVITWNSDPTCRRKVIRVTRYKTFAEMMAAEDPKKIDPTRTPEQQLKAIRKIFPPEKERLGVLLWEMEPVK